MYSHNKNPEAYTPGQLQREQETRPRDDPEDALAPTFFHPDYTVGPGFSPDLLRVARQRTLAGSAPERHTADRELGFGS